MPDNSRPSFARYILLYPITRINIIIPLTASAVLFNRWEWSRYDSKLGLVQIFYFIAFIYLLGVLLQLAKCPFRNKFKQH